MLQSATNISFRKVVCNRMWGFCSHAVGRGSPRFLRMNVLLEELCSRKVFLAAREASTYRSAKSRFRKNNEKINTVSTRGDGGRKPEDPFSCWGSKGTC